MAWSAKTYIKTVSERIEGLLEVTLRQWQSPMLDSYHPELEDSPFLDGSDISKFQMLIGSFNWIITLGRFDVHFSGAKSSTKREN